ncbi:hypothetical protein JZ751_005729 [Albula glossodonta]|uniref:G-protein coupled receptors family 1 profile domain-containing protein n=1 Tax=Albula glossodonta TaxID=121402 RepID=A0A8T2N4W3_9TELE|nr:hypothetical protein JZ751_005729 [Albula glossodonta]
MEEYDFNNYEDYNAENITEDENATVELVTGHQTHRSPLTDTLLVLNGAICLLGLVGNGLVIWIAGFRMRRTVTTTWYLSLAVSDFLFCAWLPFSMVVMARVHWPLGVAMCKLTSSVLFLNMFSSIFLLVLISADRCTVVVFPVWAQNHRTVQKAVIAIALAWIASAMLSAPSLAFRQVKGQGNSTQCYTSYRSLSTQRTVALSRFVAGFAIPLLLIVTCYSLILVRICSLQTARISRPIRIASVLVTVFFACWLPHHIFMFLEIEHQQHSLALLTAGQEVGATLAVAHSFLNPVLYVLMGKNFQKKLRQRPLLLRRMEYAMGEDGNAASRSLSMDAKASCQV